MMSITQLATNYPNLIEWLEPYVVGRFSGILHIDAVEQYGGFQAPDREADAFWQAPTSPEAADDPYVVDTQVEWWQEGEVVLGIHQASDPVTGVDHFTWYRIPLDVLGRILQKGAQPLTNLVNLRSDTQVIRALPEWLEHLVTDLEAVGYPKDTSQMDDEACSTSDATAVNFVLQSLREARAYMQHHSAYKAYKEREETTQQEEGKQVRVVLTNCLSMKGREEELPGTFYPGFTHEDVPYGILKVCQDREGEPEPFCYIVRPGPDGEAHHLTIDGKPMDIQGISDGFAFSTTMEDARGELDKYKAWLEWLQGEALTSQIILDNMADIRRLLRVRGEEPGDEPPLCDFCASWTATHVIGDTLVCDKPRCQDRAEAAFSAVKKGVQHSMTAAQYDTSLGTVSIHSNNACVHSTCPFCHADFKPGLGEWAFLSGLRGHPLCLECWHLGPKVTALPGSQAEAEEINMAWLIAHDQDFYHETRTHLRGAISQGVTVAQAAIWMMQQRGEDYFQRDLAVNWTELAHQCIDDTQELMEYEAAHGLPTEP